MIIQSQYIQLYIAVSKKGLHASNLCINFDVSSLLKIIKIHLTLQLVNLAMALWKLIESKDNSH